MEAKDVITLPWINLKNWSDLTATEKDYDFPYLYYVSEIDIDIFIENIYKNISRKLNISFEQLEPILVSENNAFYKLKNQLFNDCAGYRKRTKKLRELQNTLRIPDISNVETSTTADNLSICLELFKNLSDVEKTIFLQKIGKINIKVECFEDKAMVE